MIIHFINVGYGDSILIEDQNKTVLIDAGGNREDMYSQPGTMRTIEYLKEKGIRKIDIIIITHFHEDHICGLPQVMKQIEVGQIWLNIVERNIPKQFIDRLKGIQNSDLKLFVEGISAYVDLISLADKKHIPILEVQNRYAYENIEIFGNHEDDQNIYKKKLSELFDENDLKKLEEKALWVDKTANANSLMVRIKGETGYALFMGDRVITRDTPDMQTILNDNIHADLLKVPHHGQKDCVDRILLKSITPKNVVITSDNNNTFGGGSPETVKLITAYYQDHNIHGSIQIVGKEMKNGKNKSELRFTI